MGLDFIKERAPTFKRSWDRNRKHLAEPNLFLKYPDLKQQCYRAVGREQIVFRIGQQLLLKVDGGMVLVCDRNATVGTIHDAPLALLSAIAESGGFALGTVKELLVGGRAANVVIS